MFEKEAEEYATEHAKQYLHNDGSGLTDTFDDIKEAVKFGYNKAIEWQYPSKGEYPKEYEDILICFLTEDDMKDCVRGWYEYDFENNKHIFKYLNVLGTQYLETVIAWKYVDFPKDI